PREIEKLAAERETAVVLTAPWHERATRSAWSSGSVYPYTRRCPIPRNTHADVRPHRRAGRRRQPRRRLAPQGGDRRGAPVCGGRPTGRRRRGVSRTKAERHGALDREPSHGHCGDTL